MQSFQDVHYKEGARKHPTTVTVKYICEMLKI